MAPLVLQNCIIRPILLDMKNIVSPRLKHGLQFLFRCSIIQAVRPRGYPVKWVCKSSSDIVNLSMGCLLPWWDLSVLKADPCLMNLGNTFSSWAVTWATLTFPLYAVFNLLMFFSAELVLWRGPNRNKRILNITNRHENTESKCNKLANWSDNWHWSNTIEVDIHNTALWTYKQTRCEVTKPSRWPEAVALERDVAGPYC